MLQSLQDVPWSKINQHAPQSSAKIVSKICPAKIVSFTSYSTVVVDSLPDHSDAVRVLVEREN